MPICLSNTLNLRCLDLTRNQSIVLVIPTALEFFLCTFFFTVRAKAAHRDWLLVLEGWSFLALVILDAINHTVTLSTMTFKVIDIVVGAASSIPLVSLALFLLFLTRPYAVPLRDLQSTARASIRRALTGLMVFFIPLLVLFNETSSFVGIHFVTRSPPLPPAISFPTLPTLKISLALSLTSLTLLLMYFLLSTALVISSMLNAPRRGSLRRLTGDPPLSAAQTSLRRKFLPRKAFWFILLSFLFLNLDVLVGLIISTSVNTNPRTLEDQFDFGRILARRILKAIGRAFLVIGVKLSASSKPSPRDSLFRAERSLSIHSSFSTDTEAQRDLERARQRGAGRLSKFFSSYVFDPRVQIPQGGSTDPEVVAGASGAPRGSRRTQAIQAQRNSWVFPFRLSTTGGTSPGPFNLYARECNLLSPTNGSIGPGAWLRGGGRARRMRYRDMERELAREREAAKAQKDKQRVTVEYRRPGAAPLLKLRKLSDLSWGELDAIALRNLGSSMPGGEGRARSRSRTISLPLSPQNGNGRRSWNGNGNGIMGAERSRRPPPIPLTSSPDDIRPQGRVTSSGTLEFVQRLIPEFPATPDRAHTREPSPGQASTSATGDGTEGSATGAAVARTSSGRRKPVPRLSRLISREKFREGEASGSASFADSSILPEDAPPSSFLSPVSPSQRSIRDSLTLAFGSRVKRLSATFGSRSRSSSQTQAQTRTQGPSSFQPGLEARLETTPDPDPFRKFSPPPVPPIPSFGERQAERFSPPPPIPLSPSTLARSSPLTATAFSASRTASYIGSAPADSPLPISSPLPLQPSSHTHLSRLGMSVAFEDRGRGSSHSPSFSQTQAQVRPRPPEQVRNRLQSLNVDSLQPSRMFPSYRLSSSSSASETASGSQLSSPSLSYARTYPSPTTARSPTSAIYSPPPQTITGQDNDPRPSTSTDARIMSPTPTGTPSGIGSRGEPFPTGSPAKERTRRISEAERQSEVSQKPTPAPRLSSVIGVVHQTPQPVSTRRHVPARSSSAVPIPIARLRSDGTVKSLRSTDEGREEWVQRTSEDVDKGSGDEFRTTGPS